MHMADIVTQILDGGVAGFAMIPVGVMYVPQGSQPSLLYQLIFESMLLIPK